MIREVYIKKYSKFIWQGESIYSEGRFFYRKCDAEGYLMFEKEGKISFQDFKLIAGYAGFSLNRIL